MSKPDINWKPTTANYTCAYLALQDILAYCESPMSERFSVEESRAHIANLAKKGLPETREEGKA